jgi:hypothetical protein
MFLLHGNNQLHRYSSKKMGAELIWKEAYKHIHTRIFVHSSEYSDFYGLDEGRNIRHLDP